MKKQFILLVCTFVSLFVLASCSNHQYQEAMDKGIESLGVKNYYQASIYFELALKEKAGDPDATTYLDQANHMEKAIEAHEQKEYDSALKLLSTVVDTKSGLKTVQAEAQKLKTQIVLEKEVIASFEKELELVEDIISKESYHAAEEELGLLQSKIDRNDILSRYQTEVKKLMGQVELALVEKEEAKEPIAVDEREEPTTTEKAKPTEGEPPSEEKSVKYKVYTNDRFGFSLEIPVGLNMDPPPTNGDGARFYDGGFDITAYGGHTNLVYEDETIEDYYHADLDSIPYEIAYQRLTEEWYVLSYKENGKIIYKKFFFGESIFNTLIISYPASEQDNYGPITTHISNTFRSSVY